METEILDKTSLKIQELYSIFARMIQRRITGAVLQRLAEVPAVVLLGPRQVGKTTLALEIQRRLGGIYLDLESEGDLAKLSDPELYLGEKLSTLVILDEIHRAPHIFAVLRGLIDRGRRSGRRAGLYLLLGSASLEMLRQSGETLAGRVSYLELAPFDILEVKDTRPAAIQTLWQRGGFPESFLAASDAQSLRWRRDFIRTYLERDIPQFGRRIPAETLRRFWTMLAHYQGGPLNLSQLARNVGMDTKTAATYVELLTDLLLVRRLSPWHSSMKKRLVKSPRIFIRDSGLVHALLGIADMDALLSHPIVGASWEGFVIENLLNVAPESVEGFFYRAAGGAEVDLVLRFPDGRLWAIEIKRGLQPRPEKGFYSACEDLNPERKLVVYPGTESFRLARDIEVVPLERVAAELADMTG